MKETHGGVTLKTSPTTKKSWLVDGDGVRLSERFKLKCQQRTGALTLITTDKGSILYSKYSRDYIAATPGKGCWTVLEQLSDKVYLAGWRGMCFSMAYCLLDEKLQAVNKEHKTFSAIRTLTANLMAVQTDQGWGIIDTVTGQFVEQPMYWEIEQKDGKIIGKIMQMVESEIKINN